MIEGPLVGSGREVEAVDRGAIYRLVIQDWSKEQAIEEMTEGGYGFHKLWENLVKYIRNLDIDQIKAQRHLEAE